MSTAELLQIPLKSIRVSASEGQAMRRAAFDKLALEELAGSIKEKGVLQPIVLRPSGKGYELVAGERRVVAAGMAGLDEIPATVKDYTDLEVLGVQLVENLQREGLHPMHEAESYNELKTVHGKHPDEIAAEIRKSRTYVYNALKLLDLSKKARKAFYENKLTRSVAEKLARLPEKSQDEALPELTGEADHWRESRPMSYREACDFINEHYMLDLTKAPFPVEDPKLNNAGPCSVCPKKAGNQPQLFDDIKKGDTCTDSLCFQAKAAAYGQRQAEQARADGRDVFVGKKAKEIAPNGATGGYTLRNGFHTMTDEIYTPGGYKKVKSLLKSGEQPAIIIDPKTQRAVEIVHKDQLEKPKASKSSGPSPDTVARKKAERENKFRRAVWAALRPKLGKPADLDLARAAYNALDSELQKVVWQSRDVELKKSKYGVFDRDHHEREIEKLKGAELVSFMNDCLYAPLLRVNTWGYGSSSKTGARLLAAAKAHKIDVNKIRRELEPKKPAKKTKAKGARRHK